jgi:cytosine/adenosine deaminase-related metal-dependent hydrolase
MPARTLITGAYLVTMDDELGEIGEGQILIEGETIAAVGADLGVSDAEILDASGSLVIPGFVDTHRHTWQTCFRGVCADWTLRDYFRGVRQRISPNCGAEDVYAGNWVGALEALDAGVTTILDFSHCMNTPEHADAALAGLRDAGIRALFGYGYFPAPTAETPFGEHESRIADARRIRESELAGDDGLVTMGIALTETGLLPFDATLAEIGSAREMEVPVVLHTGCSWGSPVTEGISELAHHGLLGPEQVHVHCNTLDGRDFDRLAEADCKISSSPETELQMGMGHPVIDKALARGMRPSLSCDVASGNSGDMFAQMRIGLQFLRAIDNDTHIAANRMVETLTLGTRDALRWGTANGAHAIGMEDRIGSITPGKQADLAVIGGSRLNMIPMADPVGTLVQQANPSNVDHVLVAGKFVKRDGKLVGVDLNRARKLAEESSQRVLAAATSDGNPLLPPPDPSFDDAINAMAAANLARAWAIAPAD